MLWDPFLYCINDSIQGNSETGNKVFVLPSKVAINSLPYTFQRVLLYLFCWHKIPYDQNVVNSVRKPKKSLAFFFVEFCGTFSISHETVGHQSSEKDSDERFWRSWRIIFLNIFPLFRFFISFPPVLAMKGRIRRLLLRL